ncbi:MAG: hypothetical protein AAFW68_09600 [Pseudomonadota bacterium]
MNNPVEFSYIIDLDDLGKVARAYRLDADEDARARIAKRLKTPSLEKLEAEIKVRVSKTLIEVEGALVAALTRQCVASLELMTENIDEAFDIAFSRVRGDGAALEEDEFWDAPEIHESDQLDLGELLVQQLSLAMAAFPRKRDTPGLLETYAPRESASPFADLPGILGKTDDNQ